MTNEIDTLAEEYWSYYLETNPTEAHLLGDYGRAGEFEEATRESEDKEIAALRAFAQRAEAIDVEGLDEQQRITRAVLVSDATTRADLVEKRLRELAADPIFGEQVSMPILMGMLALPEADVAEALVGKFRGLGRYYRELADRQREGVANGRLPAAFAVKETIAQLDGLLATPIADDPLLTTTPPPAGLDVDGWKARLRAAIESDVRPGMEAYRDVLRDEVLAGARPDDKCGLSWLPDGDDAYAATLRYYTTTDKGAQEIHDIGLAQIAKLADEYRSLGPEVVGSDDLDEIFEAMRSDPKLHFESGDQLVEASEVAMQRAWTRCRAVRVLPQAPCGVQSTMTGAKAYYFPPATDGSRGGTFFVNVADPVVVGHLRAGVDGLPRGHPRPPPADRDRERAPGRAGVPQAHPQRGVRRGLGPVHRAPRRRDGALHRRRRPDGHAAADSMRACRLVVDTGLHALGWSRQQAIDFMVDNSPLKEARSPRDRPLHRSPGQACSYMVGRLEIQRIGPRPSSGRGAAST